MPEAHRPPTLSRRAGYALLAAAAGLGAPAAQAADPSDAVAIGLGRYYTQPKGGLLSSSEPLPPQAPNIGGDLAGKAVPTNQWYSSVIFTFPSEPIHAHPMTYRAGSGGFEVDLPAKQVLATDRGNNEIRFPHAPAITVAPAGGTIRGARLTRVSDWLAQIQMTTTDGQTLQATVLHGSPFSYFETSGADIELRLNGQATVVPAGADARIACFDLGGKRYAAFAPTGARWSWEGSGALHLRLPAAGRFFSIAGLPDEQPATLQQFAAVAYAFPTQTRVDWQYDEAHSLVRTHFRVSTVAREGDNLRTVMGLYPHQWFGQKIEGSLGQGYDTIRGRIRLLVGNDFVVERTYHGFVPYWGGLRGTEAQQALHSVMGGDAVKARNIFSLPGVGHGTYWTGKGLGALAQLMGVADAEGKTDMRDALLNQIESRMEKWFDGEHGTYFVQDARVGTFVGYPQEYDSVKHMNDHHFHYGYWIMAAAQVALRDPGWVAPQRWGGMVDKLVADIATTERGRADFPFLRNFDPYEGHSWASGDAAFSEGNNQESSSEAVNAWAALVLLGQARGDRALRDLGIYLYTSEIESVQNYWFDLHGQVFAPEFGKPFASMLFGGKYAYNTWWTQEPRQILGINEMPLTTASTYLAADPDHVRRSVAALPAETAAYTARGMSDGTPSDIWQDVIASYLALADPEAGYAMWVKHGSVESGETRSHTLHWLWSLREMGPPDLGVTADTPLYAVFHKADGTRTYLAYNAGPAPIQVSFSDGRQLAVAPGRLARAP